MRTFEVDEDLVEVIWNMANPKPFEPISFNDALRRALARLSAGVAPEDQYEEPIKVVIDRLIAEAKAAPKKAPTPSPSEWAAQITELKGKTGLSTWKGICDALGIDPAGDSARRKLKSWVSANRPDWPLVPDPS